MKKKLPIILIVLALIGVGTYIGLRLTGKIGKKETEQSEEKTAVREIVVQKVETRTLMNSAQVIGEIEPLASVTVIPKVVGNLERLRLPSGDPVEENTDVKAGETIAVIEHASLQAAAQAAEAQLELAKVTELNAAQEKTRWENLYKDGSATEQQRDNALTAWKRSSAQVKLAEAQLAQATASLNDATIEAPISGIVSRKSVDEGDMVGPGTPLFKIINVETVKLMAGVSERHIPNLRAGKTLVRAEVDAYPDQTFTGVVHQVSASVSPGTRTVELEVRIPNGDNRLKPGMFIRASVDLVTSENAPVVPEEAIVWKTGLPFVFVLDGNIVRQRGIKVGPLTGEIREVLEGLTDNDTIAVKGHLYLRDGETVKVIEGENL